MTSIVKSIFLNILVLLSLLSVADDADAFRGALPVRRVQGNRGYTVTSREIFRDNAKDGRSGHMGHALIDCGKGRILDFCSNCDGKRVEGHSGYGWMEYRVSTDWGKTFGPPRVLEYSKRLYEGGVHTALCEKGVCLADGRIVLFFQITDQSQPICCEPWSEPTMIVSADGGETWGEARPTGAKPGRIYDAVVRGDEVFFLLQENEHFLGTRPEHVYRVYHAGPDLAFTGVTLPIDARGKGYGALEVAQDGALQAYAYDSQNEFEMPYTVSRDAGRTWGPVRTSHVGKRIRNPQIRRLGDLWFCAGRNGGVAGSGDGLVLYASTDGIHWDEGLKVDERPKGQGTGYYSCMLPIFEPGTAPRMLLQYSHVYSVHRVNVAHRFIVAAEAPPPHTLAHWPLGWDGQSGSGDGRCPQGPQFDLVVPDVARRTPLTADRWALSIDRGRACDLAMSDTVGRFLSPTNDFTLEGWCHFDAVPEKGGVWMVASAEPVVGCRWFLTLRHDSYYPGYTWQIYSSLPDTRDSLLTTVTDLNTLTNGWHHWALSFTARTAKGEAEWSFFYDGKPSGRRAVKAFEGRVPNVFGRFGLGGAGTSGQRNQRFALELPPLCRRPSA